MPDSLEKGPSAARPRLAAAALVRRARATGTAIPGFNIPYLPMMAPVVRALADTKTVGLIMVARLEWLKFEAGGLSAIRDEYARVRDARFTRLHLDHVPVIDEDDLRVDYLPVLREALALGYESIMIDGSRLPLDENIAATRRAVDLARAAGPGIAVEAELGAVLGHEAGPLPAYDELFASGRGFTDPDEAARFAAESGCDWLSVAVGNVHGAVARARKDERKVEARLSIDRLRAIAAATGAPLVLHGGTGIRRECLREAIAAGIAKVNIATAIRQPYEQARRTAPHAAADTVYAAAVDVIDRELGIAGNAARLEAAP